MNNKTYKGVLSLVKGESLGTINISSKTEYDEIAKSIMGYGCFGDVLKRVLIDALAKHIEDWRERNIIDESFDCYDTWCEDKNYMVAFRFEDILFPSVLTYSIPTDKGRYTTFESISHFVKVDSIDKENICDMFDESFRHIVKHRLEGVEDAEKIISMILDNSIIVPF